jgi:Asp-tRNA(Asn)/Glu-tRNA(Gln) amidotransferase A subunit family amidase
MPSLFSDAEVTHELDLCYLTAKRALDLFAGGALSPCELMRALVERIESVNPAINALGDCFFEDAVAKASEAEVRWRNGTARRLEGIPVAVKDAQNLAGQRTTYGSPIYRDNIARNSDPMIERLLAAGAIVHARTTASEFCFSGVCRSPMWGNTFNPWNLCFSPGGSSGGSGAALAAGMTLLATGTDMGGSIRVPASACGVVGYKPPHGRNPDGHPFNTDRFNHCGPLARSVGDTALMQSIIAGQHRDDHDSLPGMLVYPTSVESISGMRVAWSPDLSYRAVDAEVRANTERAISRLRELGCSVEKVDLGWTAEIDQIASDWYMSATFGQMIMIALRDHPDLVSADLQRVVQVWGGRQAGIAHVLELIGRMSRSFAEAIDGYEIFVCPTMSIAAVKADQNMWDEKFEIDGRLVDPEFGYSMTHQFNLLSNCPAISVPSGRTLHGIPTGLQIIGRPFDDLTVIRAAWAFEAAGGQWYSSSSSRPVI